MTAASHHTNHSRSRGAILIIAMLVVFAIAALTLTLARTARTEAQASANELASIEAGVIERGAEQYVIGILTDQKDQLDQFSDSDWSQVPVGNGYFWVLRPDLGDSNLPLFGLVDESSKLNINTASYNSLRLLSGMTDEIAASIVDWRDEDDTPTESGAESSVYQSGRTPYSAKNAPFETVEELLLVRNVTPQLLYGQAGTGNTSQSGLSNSRTLANDNVLRNGWLDYLTIYGGEATTASDGTAKININNQQQRQQLRQLLTDKLGASRGAEVGSVLGPAPFIDVFDFANRAKLTLDEFTSIEGNITSGGAANPGNVNVNDASRDVLMCLGITEADVDNLLARRISATQTSTTSIAWVYDVLKEKSIGLGNLITAQGRMYSADIVAVSGNGRAFKHARIVIDTGGTSPRVVYRRDLTDLGFPMDRQILASLRSGKSASGGMR